MKDITKYFQIIVSKFPRKLFEIIYFEERAKYFLIIALRFPKEILIFINFYKIKKNW